MGYSKNGPEQEFASDNSMKTRQNADTENMEFAMCIDGSTVDVMFAEKIVGNNPGTHNSDGMNGTKG